MNAGEMWRQTKKDRQGKQKTKEELRGAYLQIPHFIQNPHCPLRVLDLCISFQECPVGYLFIELQPVEYLVTIWYIQKRIGGSGVERSRQISETKTK